MATFTVTTTQDVVNAGDGKLSLREAVAQANATAAADTIVFSAAVEGKTLLLTQGELSLTSDVTIDGNQNNDASRVTLDAAGGSRHFSISGAGTEASLVDLDLDRGGADDGGSLYVRDAAALVQNCGFYGNTAVRNGGAIAVESGSLTVTGSSIAAGTAGLYGGGIFSKGDLTVRGSTLTDNYAKHGGGMECRNLLTLEDSRVVGNAAYDSGGGIVLSNALASIQRSTISSNLAFNTGGGGIYSFFGSTIIADSTIADNTATNSSGFNAAAGGVAVRGGGLVLRGSTITDNHMTGAGDSFAPAGGIGLFLNASLDIANSIVAGNLADGHGTPATDLGGTITASNGHNIFGSDVAGNVAGDRENVDSSALFATIDLVTGGGVVNGAGIVPLRGNVANPALGGADPLAAGAIDQSGNARPLPAGGVPDIGAAESGFALSTKASANNDLLTGNGSANTIDGKAGHDFIRGLGGIDTLKGGDGGDLLDGGTGNDKLDGGAGIDLVTYAGTAVVVIDLSGGTDTAKRGGETDTLTGIEGAIGSSKNDSFKGDAGANLFQGGAGKDTATGGAGRDLYDFNAVAESGVGTAKRDVITDFAPGTDKIDLMGIDADTTVARNQAFHWVGTDALSGPGEVGFFTTGGNTIIRASTDTDLAAELEIQLTGIKALTAADFYL